jgi:hypothetical protein
MPASMVAISRLRLLDGLGVHLQLPESRWGRFA